MFVMSRIALIPGMSSVFSVMQIYRHSQETGRQVSHKIRLISLFQPFVAVIMPVIWGFCE